MLRSYMNVQHFIDKIVVVYSVTFFFITSINNNVQKEDMFIGRIFLKTNPDNDE